MSSSLLCYKVTQKDKWSPDNFWTELDLKDGYIHMSTKEQVKETVHKWFKGQEGLIIVCVDLSKQDKVKWEPSRNNELFPHVYGDVNQHAIVFVKDLPVTPNKESFLFPEEIFPSSSSLS